MTFREYTGKNVEEAIRAAMRDFSAELSDLDIEILSQGSRGILGMGGEEARILAAPKSLVAEADTLRAPSQAAEAADEVAAGVDDEEDPAGDQAEALARAAARRQPGGNGRDRFGRGRGGAAVGEPRYRPEGGRRAPPDRVGGDREARPRRGPREDRRPRVAPRGDGPRTDGEARESRPPLPFIPARPLEELSEQERASLQQAKSVLEDLLRLMGLEASVEIALGAETSKLNVTGSDLGVLIGRRGEKLAALQHIVNLIVAKREGSWNRISVDIENYRGRREDQLREVATRAAQRVEETGKIIQLDPMPAVERRIVHVALVENPRVRTQSVGVEPNRRIVILPAEQATG